jgi:phosphoenolpyruvate synthase/pyruvate phosphate dikinase
MADLNYASINFVGGKAANFSELARALANPKGGAKTPENAFAIPFYFYDRHLKHNQIDKKIAALIQKMHRDIKLDVEHELKAIRKAIKNAPLEADLMRQIEQRINAGGFKNMRFRSSTNAEDIEGFSGAGLYDSTSVVLGDSQKTIARGLKKVWASTWNYHAFLEREYYHIDQTTVAMAVLVHRSFPSEKANGVAITKNLYRNDYPAFVMNIQLGEESVVQPKPGVTVDQLMSFQGVSDDRDLDGPPRYISYSSLNKGKPILTDAQILQLTKELALVKRYFYYHVIKNRWKYKYDNFALDIEFKLYGDGQFYIKQARLFND